MQISFIPWWFTLKMDLMVRFWIFRWNGSSNWLTSFLETKSSQISNRFFDWAGGQSIIAFDKNLTISGKQDLKYGGAKLKVEHTAFFWPDRTNTSTSLHFPRNVFSINPQTFDRQLSRNDVELFFESEILLHWNQQSL